MKKDLIIIVAIIAAVGIGGYFIFKKPVSLEPKPPIEKVGRCGDNVCDDFEKSNPLICPIDCAVPNKEKEEKPKEQPHQASASKDSPFGFHPGNAENYSYIKDLGAKWSREGIYLIWDWIDSNRDGNYKFTQAETPAVPDSSIQSQKINYDAQWLKVPENIEVMANICPFIINPINKAAGFKNETNEMETYQDFAGKAVERYDGDNDYGCAFSSPDCYKQGDNQYPSAETIKVFQKNPIKYWQVCNQLTEVSSSNDYASIFASVQKKTYEAVKDSDSSAKVLIAGDSMKEMYLEVFKRLGGKYIDIIDLHRFGNNYDPKEDFDYIKSGLRSAGFDTSKLKFWMTETGTYSGDPSSDANKNLPYLSEKNQAAVLVKIYVSGLSYGIDKIFWAWNIVEGFSRDGGIFDYTGLVYDGCDFVNNKYECGSNIGYDKGRGVKKLSYYTYKKMTEVLEGSDWDNIETIQEKDGVYVYKFIKNGKPIWVAWNDNDSEKQITISNVNSSSVKITEAVPNYSSGKEVKDYAAGFKTETARVEGGMATIKIKDIPVFVGEVN
ncbi:MAG: hypothetical protein UW04_C0065G0006 [Parcubacteria group bacterium GW2011_GWB1_43_8]|nr:MAG: hypothetical protein UW04_C0065G0006 [Parcubacteria group bacterium GW2011_GWB1_43_8]